MNETKILVLYKGRIYILQHFMISSIVMNEENRGYNEQFLKEKKSFGGKKGNKE